MKLHYLSSHYTKNHRGQLFPLLKAFIKSSKFTDQERQVMYQISEQEVSFVDEPKEAEVCILTMSWNYYVKTQQLDLAKRYIEEANAAGKLVWTWMSGDFGVKLHFKGNYKVFRMSGHRSKLPNNHIGMPVFISDPLEQYYQSKELILPKFAPQPIVGFCGQADASITKTFKEISIRIQHWLRFQLGKTSNSPQPIQSTSCLRANLLNRLEQSRGITSNFIKRKKYRAGVHTNKSKHQTTLEFYDNIKDSHYVLCVRGGGNFSVRFYETLAMGRIPILVNTDCLLPLADEIDWKKHCVWVEAHETHKIAEKVIEFHQQHNQKSLFQLMLANRKIWKEQLRIGRFFKTYF